MKKYLSVLPLVLLLCFVVGCKDKAAMAELKQFRAQAALEEANLAIAVRAEEAWANGDIETLREIFSPDFIMHPPSGPDVSLEEAFKNVRENKLIFPDLIFSWDDTFVKGNKVAIRSNARGTHTGDIEGFPATGNSFVSRALSIARIENGKIVEIWNAEDGLSFYQQLGYELKPKEAGK